MKTIVTIDTERLREDLRNENLGVYWGGGFGGAFAGGVPDPIKNG